MSHSLVTTTGWHGRYPPRPLDARTSIDRQFSRSTRAALVEWIETSGCNWCITLNPNRSLPLGLEVDIIRSAFRDADERLLGRRFNRKDGRSRLLGFVFAEHVDRNLHFHIAIRPGFPTEPTDERGRCDLLAAAWLNRAPSGSATVEPCHHTRGWGEYISKEVYRRDFEFWTSSMWWPKKQRTHVLDSTWRDPLSRSVIL
jgi:hypothetical protein